MPSRRAANSETFAVATPSADEIRMTRLFDAAPPLVYAAMTQPDYIRQWWGNLGEGYAVPVCEVDLRVGGSWKFVSRHPDGEAVFSGVYREIAPPDRLVFTEIYDAFPEAESIVTAELSDEQGMTRLTTTMRYPSREVRDMVLQTGMEKGAALSYDRLEEVATRLAG